ncbi:uridine kinase [Planomicrobium sp. HSC-17F08]|nr:uridine kinase [Planomicrobium sp. HSC-17F08]
MKSKTPLVISIASVSGGGKTSSVLHLLKQLPKSKALFFDDYMFEGPQDVLAWVDEGANYAQWQLDPLVQDLKKLLIEPLEYILMDYPFAYQHPQLAGYIDFAFFIDTPLDIALARRMQRDFMDSSTIEIMLQMQHNSKEGRRAYLEMLQTVLPDSDRVVDGTKSLDEISSEIATALSEIRKRADS